MTAIPEFLERPVSPASVTVGALRERLAQLPPDVEMHVGVYDSHCFNFVIGTLPVTASQLTPSPEGRQLLLRVPGIS